MPIDTIYNRPNIRTLPIAFAIVLLCSAISPQTIAAETQLMPLQQLAAGLAAHPPHLGDNSDRAPYYDALDAWVNRPDAVYWDRKPETSNPELFNYYLRCIDRALHEAATQPVMSGARFWKLYSSGFLVKTPDAVFAFDTVEGPFKNIKKSPDDEKGYLFRWTPDMRKRFAELVDVLFITHEHYDHASYALVQEMGRLAKPVVVTAGLKDIWNAEPFAKHLIVLTSSADQRVDRLRVRAFGAVQAMSPGFAPSPGDPQHNVYLVRAPNGITFLHNGDNRGVDFTPWLRQAVGDGWKPDVWFKIMDWPQDIVEKVEELVRPLIVPGHEYEIGHKPAKYLFRLKRPGADRQGRWLVLTWGESFDLQNRK